MDAYTDFAQVYDELMDDTPYEEWCEFLLEIFRRYGVDDLPLNALRRRRNKISRRSETQSSISAAGQER